MIVDILILKLGGSALQSLIDCSNPWINYKQLIILEETYDLYPLCTMQIIWVCMFKEQINASRIIKENKET